jgi:hypothetical protein
MRHNATSRPAPSGMNHCYRRFRGIYQDDRHAIGRQHGEEKARLLGNQPIPFLREIGEVRPVRYVDKVGMSLSDWYQASSGKSVWGRFGFGPQIQDGTKPQGFQKAAAVRGYLPGRQIIAISQAEIFMPLRRTTKTESVKEPLEAGQTLMI